MCGLYALIHVAIAVSRVAILLEDYSHTDRAYRIGLALSYHFAIVVSSSIVIADTQHHSNDIDQPCRASPFEVMLLLLTAVVFNAVDQSCRATSTSQTGFPIRVMLESYPSNSLISAP
jgi:hypothetical protein